MFCRFTGCNLWSGNEADRATATCRFCDTDFVGMDGTQGGRYLTAESLAQAIAGLWQAGPQNRLTVLTGGEPLLQVDDALIEALHAQNFRIAIETNGTIPAPKTLDWICVSPKSGAPLIQTTGQELKLVYPQPGAEPEHYAALNFENFLLQPMDGPNRSANTQAAIAYCLAHPHWRLSPQTHKFLGLR